MDEQSTDVNLEAENTAVADSSAEENQDSEIDLQLEDESTTSNTGEDTDKDTETQGDEATENEEEVAETDEKDTEVKSKADVRKEQLNQEIRDLVAQRNQIRQQVTQVNQQAYQPKTVDQLLEEVNPDSGEYYNRLEAQLESMKQSQAVRDYTDTVAEQRLVLTNEAQKALQDFPMFDESNKDEYDAELSAQADQLLGNALVVDPRTNQIIGSRQSPYQIYQALYDATQRGATKGQVAAQKAQSRMLANADSTESVATSSKSKDPVLNVLLEGLDD